MTYLVAFIILTRCLLVQGNLEWKVLKKITEYGQNVTLVCNVSNCCPKSAGWDKYTPQQRTIIIDVKTWRPNKKYDGYVLTDGYTLVIRNLTKQDLNIAYSCVYDFSLGDQQYLLEENVFDYVSTTHQNSPFENRTFSAGDISTTQQNGQIGNQTFSAGDISTTQQNGKIGNQTFSAGTIAGIILGVSTAVLVAIFIICFWKRRKERHRNTRNSIEGEERNIIRKEPEIALQESLGADQVKAEHKAERNIIRKEPVIALQETLAADTVKAEGEERNIIRKEPEIALQESLGADKVNAEREESNMIYTRKEPEITLHESFGADKMKVRVRIQAGERVFSNVNERATGTAISAGFTEEEINFTKMGMIALNIFADVLYDLLKPDKPHLRPRCDCDITYLYSEHRKLNKHVPSNSNHPRCHPAPWGGGWQDFKNTDIAIGDDIERIRLTRNELQHSQLFKLDDMRFNELSNISSDLLKRFDRHNTPTKLYTDRLKEILAKSISKEEVKSIENEISGMTIEVEIEH
ncbi:uncharacterized protein LOC143083525 [Mytilus galloprovincialis]|uniref:uncharacterized protein LOC143083525 n=1 Tax=Mytilus galloprovincialis TaxID=29158 RepID=UPI003F7C2E74